MADFNSILQFVFADEGGWTAGEGDPGGETYSGIARNFHGNWDGWTVVDGSKPLTEGQVIPNPALDLLEIGRAHV